MWIGTYFSQSWSASSICHLSPITSQMHAQAYTCIDLQFACTFVYICAYICTYTNLCVHARTKMHTQICKYAFLTLCNCRFSPSLHWESEQANLHGVSSESIHCSHKEMWEECVNVREECVCSAVYPEDLGKSVSISRGQKTQSDPCYTLTKVLIRISLKGRKRQGEKHIACSIGCFGQEPVGWACCSVTLNLGDVYVLYGWSLLSCLFFYKP